MAELTAKGRGQLAMLHEKLCEPSCPLAAMTCRRMDYFESQCLGREVVMLRVRSMVCEIIRKARRVDPE